MLLAVWKDSLELNIKQAVEWWVLIHTGTRIKGAYFHYRAHSAIGHEHRRLEAVIKKCIQAFPLLWVSCNTCYKVFLAERSLPYSILSVSLPVCGLHY
jgi:hypothetical protein